MSPTADPQRRPERPRAERTKISTILPPTERARLVALGAHAKPAEGATSSSSAAPSGARPDSAMPRQEDTSGTQDGDEGAAPTAVQSPCPPRDGGSGVWGDRHPVCFPGVW